MDLKTGERIAIARKRAKMTQEALAKKLGVSRPTLANIESGGQSPRMSLVKEAAEVLGIELAELVL